MRGVWLALLVGSGCFVEGDGQDGGGAAASDGASDSTGDTAAIGDASGGSDDALDGTTSGADSDSDGSSDDFDGDTDGTDEATGGAPDGPCWDLPAEDWTLAEFDAGALQPGALTTMALSGDGLDLLYTIDDGRARRSYVATRQTVAESFAGGTGFAQWANPGAETIGGLRYAGTELLVSLLDDGKVATSVFSDGLWWPPEPVEYQVAPVEMVGTPSLYDGGRGMMVDVRDGPQVDGFPTLVPYEARRVDTDAGFGSLERTIIPGWSLNTPVLCVVASPDGEHIVFGGAFPAEWGDSEQTLSSALDIWHAARQQDGTWGTPEEIESISHETLLACPISITADGCGMTLRHFSLDGETTELALAVR